MTKKTKLRLTGGLLLTSMLATTVANADSITYYLDDANWKSLLPDNNFYYVSVTIDD